MAASSHKHCLNDDRTTASNGNSFFFPFFLYGYFFNLYFLSLTLENHIEIQKTKCRTLSANLFAQYYAPENCFQSVISRVLLVTFSGQRFYEPVREHCFFLLLIWVTRLSLAEVNASNGLCRLWTVSFPNDDSPILNLSHGLIGPVFSLARLAERRQRKYESKSKDENMQMRSVFVEPPLFVVLTVKSILGNHSNEKTFLPAACLL